MATLILVRVGTCSSDQPVKKQLHALKKQTQKMFEGSKRSE